MSIYLVRLQGNKEFVGLFWADNLTTLYWTIDECTDPNICEIKKLSNGGVYWPMEVPSLPIAFNEDEEYEDTLTKFPLPRLSETLYDAIFDDCGWRNVEWPRKTGTAA